MLYIYYLYLNSRSIPPVRNSFFSTAGFPSAFSFNKCNKNVAVVLLTYCFALYYYFLYSLAIYRNAHNNY